MMYNSGLVAVIVSSGKIVRELGGTVYLPFGSEYSLRFKNNKNQRAVVSVFLDGKDAMNGNQLVVDANSESDLKGFLEADGSFAKNAFRFIEKTKKISEYRGDKIDDGIIRIEFQYEQPAPFYPQVRKYTRPPFKGIRNPEVSPDYIPPSNPWISYEFDGPLKVGESGESSPLRGFASNPRGSSIQNCSFTPECGQNQIQAQSLNCCVPQNEAGITVAGSLVNQKFASTHTRSLEIQKHIIVFELKGCKSNGELINQPILTRVKTVCPTCGKQCKSSAKFCSECSTCLV